MSSAVEAFAFQGRDFFIKHDEQLHPFLSGNKYRKLYTLLQTPSAAYETLISYGGTQSNAMLSMAYLAHLKQWQFRYYTKKVPLHVKALSHGNLHEALQLGMQLIELEHEAYEKRVQELFFNLDTRSIVVPQGGADSAAKEGVARLGEEIKAFKKENGLEKIAVATPSGTGTTAYYLAEVLQDTVYTTPVVGDQDYLVRQMQSLGTIAKNLKIIETKKRYRFAAPHEDLLHVNRELLKAGVAFDLLYAPKMWMALLEHECNLPLLYVHSGGLSGNETMLERYRYKGML